MVLAAVCALNLLAYGAFFIDKRSAKAGNRRISERTLLGFAVMGGSLGAKLAQSQFRHKTRKQPFARILNVIVFLHCVALVALLYLWLQLV